MSDYTVSDVHESVILQGENHHYIDSIRGAAVVQGTNSGNVITLNVFCLSNMTEEQLFTLKQNLTALLMEVTKNNNETKSIRV